MQAHVDYIHYNPVKHAHVRRVVDWLTALLNAVIWPVIGVVQGRLCLMVDLVNDGFVGGVCGVF